MVDNNALFEVESRCHFENRNEADKVLPFLHSCLKQEVTAFDTYYGLELFRAGQLLRVSNVLLGRETRYYLAWKGPDIGRFANIRQELGEDVTTGIVESSIMKRLGGKARLGTCGEIIQEIEKLGHHAFMSNKGRNLKGRWEPLGIDVKLMTWSKLKWPLMVEFEKIAHTQEEACQFQEDLRMLSLQLNLEGRLVKEEPPTQLYGTTFGLP